jgi:sarcosine oxidase
MAFLQQQKISHREFNTAQLSAYTQMRFAKGEVGFLEEQTGALMAGRGVQSVVADMPGIARVTENIRGIESDKLGIVQVGRIAAKSAVFACGPWLPKLFPALLTDKITPTRQEVYHFGSKPGDTRFASPALPTWADFNNGNIVYGMPDLKGQGFKIAFDAHGAEVDPDTLDRRVSVEGVAQARAYLAKRFPDLAAAPLIHSRVCQYENTSNGDFLIDRHPDFPTVWLVGGGSGHGLKHGPAVGRRVAEHVLDPAKPVEPRFALASKQTVAKRSVY